MCETTVPSEVKYTNYFVLGSGTSTQHLHTMVYHITKMYNTRNVKVSLMLR